MKMLIKVLINYSQPRSRRNNSGNDQVEQTPAKSKRREIGFDHTA